MVKLLPTIDSRYQIAIEGHTDDVPIHTARYDSNWDLSSARAINVLKQFTAAGISPQRLSAQGYAETRPATTCHRRRAAAQTRARSENRTSGDSCSLATLVDASARRASRLLVSNRLGG